MKVAINRCWGGFGLSEKALRYCWERGLKEVGTPFEKYFGNKTPSKSDLKFVKLTEYGQYVLRTPFVSCEEEKKFRSHPVVIECIEKLGKEANDSLADIKIVEIPDGIEWEINDYDGMETIEEVHQYWS